MEKSKLSEFIQRDLIQHLSQRRRLPFALTIAAMAAHYRVSPTPVRSAIDGLIARNILVKQNNGRLQLGRSSALPRSPRGKRVAGGNASLSQQPKVPGVAMPEALNQAALRLLIDEIVRASLQGDQRYVREEASAAECGLGRAAIRQIFSHLQGQGLITHVPRCGWKVKAFDLEAMNQYLDVRETLEKTALRLAKEKLQPDRLLQMLSANRRVLQRSGHNETRGVAKPPRQRSAELNNEIHHYLIQQSGNRYLIEFFDRHSLYFDALFQMAVVDQRTRRKMARQHCVILEALCERNWKQAAAELSRHIRDQRPIVAALLRQIQGRIA